MNSRTGSGFMSLPYLIKLCNFFKSYDSTKDDEYALVTFVLWYWSILIIMIIIMIMIITIIIIIIIIIIILIITEYNAGYESRSDWHSFQVNLA